MDWSFHQLVGTSQDHLAWWQMTIRALLILLYGLAVVRIGGRPMFGRSDALDIILAITIGSTLSRTLTGNAPFISTLIATTIMVFVYWAIAIAAYQWRWIGWLVKGDAIRLVRDGHINWQAMRRYGLTHDDLLMALRSKDVQEVEQVRAAYMERNGNINVIRRD